MIETPEQLRAVSDPMRQRLLQGFAEARTIKQAAARLGEPVTKLYHHVDRLLEAGLIRVVREEKRRAATERTFQASAPRFAVSPSAFAAGDRNAARDGVARGAVEELLGNAADEEGAFRLMRSSARLSEASVQKLEAEIARLIGELESPAATPVSLLLLLARGGD